jgi:hypothetical protein
VILARRRRLRRRFGAEYKRLVDDRDSRSQAEAELVLRERYVSRLGVRPLDPVTRERIAARWAMVHDKFASDPVAAVVAAQRLLTALLRERGYPIVHREQVMSDLSVDHAELLDHVRSACDIFERTAAGMALGSDLRQAEADYRALFAGLLAEPADDGVAQPADDDNFVSVTSAGWAGLATRSPGSGTVGAGPQGHSATRVAVIPGRPRTPGPGPRRPRTPRSGR